MSKKSGKVAKDLEEQTYEIREIVLAKIRGFPPWPAQIVDPSNLPEAVMKERPSGKSSSSGKKASTFYCVRFFPVGDHSWVSTPNLSKLKRHEIEAYISEPRSKREDILLGYKVALEPEEWEKKRAEDMAAAVDEDEAEPEEEIDELEGEEEADDEEKKPKKRKRDSETASKAKASKPKKEKPAASESASKKKKSVEKAEKPAKSKKNGVKSKAVVESEDEGERAETAGPSKKASPPPAKKQKHSGKDDDADPELAGDPGAGKVRDWRHKLQRAFLSKSVPKDEDMPGLDNLFTEVEEFDMTIKYLQYSKIGKVMRHIAALSDDKVPRDGEFQFKDRAQALVNKWHNTIQSDKANGDTTTQMDVDKKEESAAPNGDAAPETTDTGAGDVSMAETHLGDLTTISEVA